ncbi:hypothetical protein BgiBS90_004109 [Biomphalaria glabrata]|nr:hypothetical protein BgiBS90_004109 [Biomphalaria glabrata]
MGASSFCSHFAQSDMTDPASGHQVHRVTVRRQVGTRCESDDTLTCRQAEKRLKVLTHKDISGRHDLSLVLTVKMSVVWADKKSS